MVSESTLIRAHTLTRVLLALCIVTNYLKALEGERQRLTVNDSDNLGGERCRLLLPVTLRYSPNFSSSKGAVQMQL